MIYKSVKEIESKKSSLDDGFIDRYTLSKYLKFIRPGFKLLDIGCRNGELSRLIENVDDYYGVELDDARVRRARARGLNVIKADVETDLNFQNNFFDVVVLSHVLEHLKSPFKVIEKCRNLLKTRGILILVVPNPFALSRILFSALFRRKYFPFTKTEVTHFGHFQLFDADELRNIFNIVGFRIIKITHSPYVKMKNYLKVFFDLFLSGFGESLIVVARKN